MDSLRPEYVPHGLRSTFRDWAAETTAYPNHVVEMALAHSVGNAVEKAYRRGDLFEKRRKLMQTWSDYCARPAPTGATVTQFPAQAGK
jgi:integrase